MALPLTVVHVHDPDYKFDVHSLSIAHGDPVVFHIGRGGFATDVEKWIVRPGDPGADPESMGVGPCSCR